MVGWLAVALAGAFTCTVCDHLHATHDVLSYPHVVWWAQAWWVPLLFGGATVFLVAGAGWTRRILRAPEEQPQTLRQLAGNLLAFVAAYALTAVGHTLPDVVLAVLVAWWLSRWLAGAPLWLLLYSVLVGIGGTLFEASWSGLGFFRYHHADLLGVPRWLPGIYLHAAFLAAALEPWVGGRRSNVAPRPAGVS